MADILKIAEQLNSEVTRLNNERSRLEGMRESALTSYEKAVKAYEEKYGVKLDENNIQAEYNNVFAHTKGAVLDLQEKVESIKRGDYKSEDTGVEFDLEPDVEPIRAKVDEPVKTVVEDEVKAEEVPAVETPAPKKRGRKPKAATQVVEPETLAVPEEIAPKKEEEIELPQGPLNLNLDFNDMGKETVVSSPVSEKVVEDKKEEKPVVNKSETPDLDAIMAATEGVVQKPESANMGMESDDEVSVGDLDLPFGMNPNVSSETEEEDTSSDDEVDVSGFGNFGGFGDFSGFGGFGGFGEETKTETVEEKVEPKVEDKPKVEDASFGDFGGFGDFSGFGGFGGSAVEEVSKDAEKETKKADETPVTPEGWGSDANFNFGADFDSILSSTDIKFGE